MVKATAQVWPLNEEWSVGINRYNWILYRKSGNRWRADSNYPSVEMLLKAFHRKLTRTEPLLPELVDHIEHCFDVAQAATDLFQEHIDSFLCDECQNALVAASASLQEVNHAS